MFRSATKTLKVSVWTLFSIGLIGQLAFAIYIFIHFGGTAIKGDWGSWTEGMIHGIIEGDPIGNVALVIHILLAFIITVCGPLQFFKYFRAKARKFHKWNGRLYIFTALLISVGALFMVWNRPVSVGGEIGRIANSVNAVLIICFSILTWISGMQRKFEEHRKWAIRTFIVVSGVWFFRIGYGTWFLLTGFAAPGVAEDLSGPFDRFLYFASYLLPLAIGEIYMLTKESKSRFKKYLLSGLFFVLGILLMGGSAVAAKVFWLT